MRLAQAKSPAERKKEAELKEQAAKKKLKELKKKLDARRAAKEKKRQAELKTEHEKKLKEEARAEEKRKLKAEEEARLEAERRARQEEQARAEQERRARFIKQLGGHPCNKFDVNNKAQVRSCLQALDDARIKKNDHTLRDLFGRGSPCKATKDNLARNLEAMGFWKDAIDKRIPSCKLFADLHKEKHGEDVYWSSCIEKPRIETRYIFDCINFSKQGETAILYAELSTIAHYYKKNLEAAGHTVDAAYVYYDDIETWEAVKALRDRQKSALLEERNKRSYKFYGKKTPERKKSDIDFPVSENAKEVEKHYIDLVVAQLQYGIFDELSDTADNRHVLLGLTHALSNRCPNDYRKKDWKTLAKHLAHKRDIDSGKTQRSYWFGAAKRYIDLNLAGDTCRSALSKDIWNKSIIWIGEESDWKKRRNYSRTLTEKYKQYDIADLYFRNFRYVDMHDGPDSEIQKAIREDVNVIGPRKILVCRYGGKEADSLLENYIFWKSSHSGKNKPPSSDLTELWQSRGKEHVLLKIPAKHRSICPSTSKEAKAHGAKPITKVRTTRLGGYYLLACSYKDYYKDLYVWYKRSPSMAKINKGEAGYATSPYETPVIGLSECPSDRRAMKNVYGEFTP